MGRWITVAVALGALALGGVGGAVTGWRAQQASVDASRLAAVRAQRAADARVASITSVYADRDAGLAKQQAAIDAELQDLARRTTDLDARTAALNASSFGDGLYQVGRDIQPGVYRETQPVGSCYYALLRSSQTSDIIDNANTTGPATVTLSGAVAFFDTTRCGTWVKIG